MTNRHLWRVVAAGIALIAVIAFVLPFAQARKEQSGAGRKKPVQEGTLPPQLSVKDGRTVIRLNSEEQSQAGIETTSLKAAHERKQLAVPAVVLGVQSLVTMASSYATAQAHLVTAENNLKVSRPEYNRLKSLYANQNVSARDFQAAKGKFQNDQASLAAARQAVAYQTAALRQVWGDAIAKWAAGNSPELQRVLNREDVLVEVTLPAGGHTMAPAELSLELPNRRHVGAKRVSSFPQVDPRIQGPAFLYVAKRQGELEPGLNVVAHISQGRRLSGVIVPRSAVVWLNGDSWVYVQTAAHEFTRFAVSTGHPVAGGLFVSKGIATGAQVVCAGAQMLLSTEFQGQSGGEGDND